MTPEPPYWAVIFTARLREPAPGYGPVADRLLELAAEQPGFLGVESTRDETGLGITVSYWREREDFERWRAQNEHAVARGRGRREWYAHYDLRVARVERAVSFTASDED